MLSIKSVVSGEGRWPVQTRHLNNQTAHLAARGVAQLDELSAVWGPIRVDQQTRKSIQRVLLLAVRSSSHRRRQESHLQERSSQDRVLENDCFRGLQPNVDVIGVDSH